MAVQLPSLGWCPGGAQLTGGLGPPVPDEGYAYLMSPVGELLAQVLLVSFPVLHSRRVLRQAGYSETSQVRNSA